MELEGLRRSVAKIKEEGLMPDIIVTDRHPQITKWIKENLPETAHMFDVWHIAKCKLQRQTTR